MRPSALKRLLEMEAKCKSAKPTEIDQESWAFERSGLTREQLIQQYGGIPQYAYHLIIDGVNGVDIQAKSVDASGSPLERYKAILNG